MAKAQGVLETSQASKFQQINISNLVFDDIIASLDKVIQEWDKPVQRGPVMTRPTSQQPSRSRANDHDTQAVVGQVDQQSDMTLDAPEQIKAAVKLQAQGINPITRKKENISMRKVGPKNPKPIPYWEKLGKK